MFVSNTVVSKEKAPVPAGTEALSTLRMWSSSRESHTWAHHLQGKRKAPPVELEPLTRGWSRASEGTPFGNAHHTHDLLIFKANEKGHRFLSSRSPFSGPRPLLSSPEPHFCCSSGRERYTYSDAATNTVCNPAGLNVASGRLASLPSLERLLAWPERIASSRLFSRSISSPCGLRAWGLEVALP